MYICTGVTVQAFFVLNSVFQSKFLSCRADLPAYMRVLLCLVLSKGATFCVFLGYDIFERQPVKDSLVSVPDTSTGLGTPPLRLGCFYMLVFVPITCALFQLAAWSRFTLHGRKLQGIKTLRQGSQQGHLIDVKAI